GLGALHPGDVLDRARDADRKVECGSDDLPGLPDLVVARGISGIDGGAARADGGAERVCQGLEHLEELLLHGASTGHHYFGFRQLGAFALDRIEADDLDAFGGLARGDFGHRFYGRAATARLRGGELTLARRGHLNAG